MILRNFIYGIIIGLGFIIPGVSGGVLATILGIYDNLVERIINFKQDIKNNFLYITPLLLGIALSIFLFSKIILYLLNYKLMFISYVFIGLILGCLPYLIQEIKNKSQKGIAFIPFIIAFILGLILYIIQNSLKNSTSNPSTIQMILAGIFYAFGKIVPGISGASLLMLLGVYKYFLNIIANPYLITLKLLIKFIPFIISLLISAYFILKLINYLLKNHFRYTYSAIIGFIISSILFIYPGEISLLSIIITILSFTISYYLSSN